MAGEASPFRERRFRAQDGLQLYYRDYGDATAPRTAILCLSGLTRNSKDFHALATRLSAQRRVLCPDYRGRGRSQWDPDYRNYRPEVYLGDVIALLAATNVHRAVVIGTSLGGLLAMGLAAAQPASLAGVVLNDVGPEINPDGAARIADYVGNDVRYPDYETAAAALKAQFGHAYPDISHQAWLNSAARTFVDDGEGGLRLDYDLALGKALAEQAGRPMPDLWPLFGALKHIPVLAIRGALSDVLSEATFERMAREKPDLVRVTLANRGHVPELDEPESVEALDAFLADL